MYKTLEEATDYIKMGFYEKAKEIIEVEIYREKNEDLKKYVNKVISIIDLMEEYKEKPDNKEKYIDKFKSLNLKDTRGFYEITHRIEKEWNNLISQHI